MRRPSARQHGFTITEALVAAVIFSIATAGIFATISALKKPSVKTDKSLEAAYIGQRVLEDLRSGVDANPNSAWNDSTNPKTLTAGGPYNCPAADVTPSYTCTYTVTQQPNGAREVDVHVSCPECPDS